MTRLIHRTLPSLHPLDGLGGWIRRCVALLTTWQRRSRERAQIAQMTDRELRDAGLTRSEAVALSDKPFWR
jgi:uncharacterized protein YjiS (DUF1127 family)